MSLKHAVFKFIDLRHYNRGGPSGSGRPTSSGGGGGGGGVSGLLGGIDLSVQVLTTGSWPTPGGNGGAVPQCTLPPQLAAACERYKDFYLSSHNGRRLSWLTCMGTADLRATFGAGDCLRTPHLRSFVTV